MSSLRKSLVSDDEMKNFFEIVDLSFMSRRKNIKNNLKSKKIDWDSLQIDNQLRPEDLSLESYLKIAREIAKI
jgi:16S rRNA A1518/A1519 N6-dimethyltransferase RsmA/KsgA/DIM1 with predicted DNA glycosylase/AP lyase activity